MKRVGLLGGTFDPPTLAHVDAAVRAREELGLDEVWLVPARPVHKSDVTSGWHRLEMCRIAVRDALGVEVSSVELDRAGVSRSYETLEALTAAWRDVEFTFLIGDDVDVLSWWRGQECLEKWNFVRLARPGGRVIQDEIPRIVREGCGASSTTARADLSKTGHSDVLDTAVEEYIQTNGLYQSNKVLLDFGTEMRELVQ